MLEFVWYREQVKSVNKRELNDYFGRQTLELIVKQPLNLTNTVEQYDVIATVAGGGPSGQAGAIRHGISVRYWT